jgi:hypothetical protein
MTSPSGSGSTSPRFSPAASSRRPDRGRSGEPYLDGDGATYLPLLVQPGLVFEATAAKLRTVRERAQRRQVPLALYTIEMFSTGHDDANRAAARAVRTDDLDIVGLALRAPHRDADAVLRGLVRHP